MSVGKQSTVRFLFPFSFAGNTFADRCRAIESVRWGQLKEVWQHRLLDADDLLPVVERYLNGSDQTVAQSRCWRLSGAALQSPQGLAGGAKNASGQWTVQQRKINVAFCFRSIELVLFQAGVGFLVVEATPESDHLEDWLDLIHVFRFFEGRGTRLQCSRDMGNGRQEAFFPNLNSHQPVADDGSQTMAAIAGQILMGAALVADERPWWQEAFILGQAIPFTSIFLKGTPVDQDAETLYRLRNLFYSSQEICLGPDDEDLSHSKLLHYAQRQWFVVSLDGAHFAAFDAPQTPFFESTLPGHLGNQYLLLFLLALHQRFKLINFSEEVAQQWSRQAAAGQTRAFESLNQDILGFRAQGLFGQIGQRDHLHRYFLKLKEVYEIDQLFSEVSEEIRDMHGYMQLTQAEHLESRLNFLAVALGVPGLVLGFLGVNLAHLTSGEGINGWIAASATLLISAAIGYCGLRYLNR